MTINLDEKLIPLADVAKYVPGHQGKPISVSTIFRWASTGVRGVVLESWRAGGMRVTTTNCLQRFLAGVTEACDKNRARNGLTCAAATLEGARD